MRIERAHNGSTSSLSRVRNDALDSPLMAEVDSIEVADRHDRRVEIVIETKESTQHTHQASSPGIGISITSPS